MTQQKFFGDISELKATVVSIERYYLYPNMSRLNLMNKAAFLYVLRISTINHEGPSEEYDYCERCFTFPSWKIGERVHFFKSSHKVTRNLAKITSGYRLLIPIPKVNQINTYPTNKRGFIVDHSVEAYVVYKYKYEFILELFIMTLSFIIISAMVLTLPLALIYFFIKWL